MVILTNIFVSVLTSIGAFALLGRLLEKYLMARIESAVQLEYNLKLEEYKIEHEKRMKAQLIAELLSEWISLPEDKKMLNKLTFEAFIWLPEDIASKLSSTLSHAAGAPGTKDVIVEVRKLIHGKEDSITADSIIHFQ